MSCCVCVCVCVRACGSIMKCDVDIRKDLYANVVISGGTTMCNPPPTHTRVPRGCRRHAELRRGRGCCGYEDLS